ncbi:DUF1253-domain-containing protein [Exidia glandulosa HHB12029]|uniref:U3 small nucleolar RNA-associated protein 25 n=1 Tax=Exidia glandulosa HHB12029 TaxID=1314781 RepID=A0A165JLT0_EXIGL|nr:DUF1253-domain-containing protein [Exidia glandulosa HHB12029]
MGADSEATVTRLLTLLNVSATRSKRKIPSTPVVEPVKLNKRSAAELATTDVVEAEQQGESNDVNMDDIEDDADEAKANDPYSLHFSADSIYLTAPAREAVVAGRWKTKRRKIDHVGRVVEVQPENGVDVQDIAYRDAVLPKLRETFDSKESSSSNFAHHLLSTASTYQDLYLARTTLETDASSRGALALHALNHVSKIRRKVLKTNERIAHAAKTPTAEQPSATEIQDQGFTRPSVLILLPFRNSALKWVKSFLAHVPTHKVENLSRFEAEFGLPAGTTDKLSSAPAGTYPRDHVETFKGNVDDNFRVGVKLTRKSVKLFADFYSSDIVIASPLGLRLSIGKEKGADFLSSIEVMVVDQADAMTMQNWDHVQFVMSQMNSLPKEAHDTDFSRVKPWFLDGHAKYLRQTILMTAYETPETRALFNHELRNVAGKIRTEHAWQPVSVPEGISQNFVKFDCSSVQSEPDKRFEYFTKQMLPTILKSAVQSVKTMIFVPSYFDFVRLKNYMKALEMSFTVLSEYSTNQDISRARQAFFAGDKAFLLMTERFYFFRRYKIRGIRNLVFYQAPEHAQFYGELLTFPFLDDGVDASDVTARVLYSKYDCMRLERIAGTAGLPALLDS